nr:hypothetical protein [Salmonella enterica]WCS70261.1 hypothetical protein [Salmonella enterica subsp. enterica serovar Rissen]
MDPSAPFMKVSSLPVKLLTSRVERRYSNIMLNVQNNTRHERQKDPYLYPGTDTLSTTLGSGIKNSLKSLSAADDDARRKLYLARDVAVINADSSMLADIIK